MRPDPSRVVPFAQAYIALVNETELRAAFINHTAALNEMLDSIPPGKYDYAYAPGKWTIKEVVPHLIDAERIFIYRAVCFARKDPGPFPSFDENAYADNSKAGRRSWDVLVEELRLVRGSSKLLYDSFDEEQLESGGISSNHPSYVRGIGYILLGHATHHMNLIKERYL